MHAVVEFTVVWVRCGWICGGACTLWWNLQWCVFAMVEFTVACIRCGWICGGVYTLWCGWFSGVGAL
jgi:hypothetical protein